MEGSSVRARFGLIVVVTSMLLTACSRPADAPPSAGRGAPDPSRPTTIVGSEGKGMWAGAGVPPGNPPIFAARDGATPAGITPLAKDIFSTRDFYADRDLWLDKRYYRCNSPVGI